MEVVIDRTVTSELMDLYACGKPIGNYLSPVNEFCIYVILKDLSEMSYHCSYFMANVDVSGQFISILFAEKLHYKTGKPGPLKC